MPSGRRRPFAGSGATCWLAEVRCNALQWRMRRRWRRRWGRRRWRRSRGGGGRAGAGGDNPPFCPSVPFPPPPLWPTVHTRPRGVLPSVWPRVCKMKISMQTVITWWIFTGKDSSHRIYPKKRFYCLYRVFHNTGHPKICPRPFIKSGT